MGIGYDQSKLEADSMWKGKKGKDRKILKVDGTGHVAYVRRAADGTFPTTPTSECYWPTFCDWAEERIAA